MLLGEAEESTDDSSFSGVDSRSSQSQGNVTLGRGRGVPSQYGGTEPSSSGPSPGRTLGVVVTAESNPGESAPRRASGSRRERRESPYKPYTPREPSMCKSEGWRKDTHRMYAFLLAQSDPDISAEEAEKLITPVLDHMWRNRAPVVLAQGGQSGGVQQTPE